MALMYRCERLLFSFLAGANLVLVDQDGMVRYKQLFEGCEPALARQLLVMTNTYWASDQTWLLVLTRPMVVYFLASLCPITLPSTR